MPHEIALPDGRGTVRLHWTPGRKRPAVQITVDGAPVALEAVDLLNGAARERLVVLAPADLRDAVRDSLVALATETAPRGSADDGDTVALVRPVICWPEPVNAHAVLDALMHRVGLHMFLPLHAGVVVGGWILLTYLLSVLPVAPILWVRSPTRGCGKSTLLDLLALLGARTLKSENATLSALFRIAERDRATLILDELDQWLIGDRHGEITGLLNAGFTRGGRFLRSAGDDHEPKAFDVFGFRAVAGIGKTLHDTTRSRAYGITLERAPAGVRPQPLQAMHAESWADPLRQQLAQLAEQLRAPLSDRLADVDATPLPEHLDGRARDLWAPLVALGAEIGGPFAVLIHEACEHTTRRDAQDEGDTGVLLLLDVRRYFDEHGGRSVQPKPLLEWLHEQDGAPWGEYRAGRPLSARGLSDLLKRFSLKATGMARHNGELGRWFHPSMFADAWMRYCPTPADEPNAPGAQRKAVYVSDTSATRDTSDTLFVSQVADVADVSLAQTETHCGHSTGADTQSGREPLGDDYFLALMADAA